MQNAAPLTSALTPPYDENTEAMLLKWMPPGLAREPLELFRVLAAAPGLMTSMLPLGAHFLGRQKQLSLKQRELVILSACSAAGCAYEWGVHVAAFAEMAGLDDKAVRALHLDGADSPLWTDEEAAIIAAAREVIGLHTLRDETKASLQSHFDAETRLTIVALAGWYGIIAAIANSCCTGPEARAGGFPSA